MTALSPKRIPSELCRALVPPLSLTPPAGSRVTPPWASPPRLLFLLAPKDCCTPREALPSQGRLHPCTALHCFALHPYTALHCTALHCTPALPCIAPQHCTVLPCTARPHYTVPPCTARRSTALRCTAPQQCTAQCSLVMAAGVPCQQMELTTRLVPGHPAPDPQSGGAKGCRGARGQPRGGSCPRPGGRGGSGVGAALSDTPSPVCPVATRQNVPPGSLHEQRCQWTPGPKRVWCGRAAQRRVMGISGSRGLHGGSQASPASGWRSQISGLLRLKGSGCSMINCWAAQQISYGTAAFDVWGRRPARDFPPLLRLILPCLSQPFDCKSLPINVLSHQQTAGTN